MQNRDSNRQESTQTAGPVQDRHHAESHPSHSLLHPPLDPLPLLHASSSVLILSSSVSSRPTVPSNLRSGLPDPAQHSFPPCQLASPCLATAHSATSQHPLQPTPAHHNRRPQSTLSPPVGMSATLPPPRRRQQPLQPLRLHNPPESPTHTLSPEIVLGPPSVAGSSASVVSTPAGVADLSATEMEDHLAVLEGLGPPGAVRRPSRRVKSIERTWAWVRSRSSVYGEAALMNLESMHEHGSQPSDPGPSRPATVAASGNMSPTKALRRQSTATDMDPEERRRRRQGLTPESGLRPPPRPRPVSRSMTLPIPESTSPPSAHSSSSAYSDASGPSNAHSADDAKRDCPRPIIPPSRSAVSSPVSMMSSSTSSSRTPVRSINDIVKRHSSAVALAEETAKGRARAELASRPDLLAEKPRSRVAAVRPSVERQYSSPTPVPAPAKPIVERQNSMPVPSPTLTPIPKRVIRHQREASVQSSISVGSSDTDSVVRDYRLAQAAFDQLSTVPAPAPTPPPAIVHPPSRNIFGPTPESSPRRRPNGTPDHLDTLHRQRSTTSLLRPKSSSPGAPDDDDARGIALYLRSPQLNRILHIPRPFPDRPLQVSLADLGKPDGRPVVVFLGLGCVRYLIGLYDDLARALGLRLICIDRWGLGKTDQVPQDRRGPLDWAEVVRGVLDELGIQRFQIVAHSAGAPYALATVLRMEKRVHGKIHLLSPWVGGDVEGYKWLKWIPNGVIKSALAAEWRLESYFLGKAPTLKAQRLNGKKDASASTTSLSTDGFSRTSLEGMGRSTGDSFDTLGDVYSSLPLNMNSFTFTSSPAFAHALMQASHAESLSGTTADLLSVVLGRDAKPWGFSYTDIRSPCKIWYGAEDDRVSEKSMRWMERAMDAELLVVPEEGHNLMSSRSVMYDVLDSLAEDI